MYFPDSVSYKYICEVIEVHYLTCVVHLVGHWLVLGRHMVWHGSLQSVHPDQPHQE